MWEAGGVAEEAVTVGDETDDTDDTVGRCAGSLSRADLDREFAESRSAMDYAMGRLAGGGSDGSQLGYCHQLIM